MDWFKELYDDFRMRTGFGSIPEDQTRKEVDPGACILPTK